MKIIKDGEPRVIMSNPHSRHSYFGWPTVAKLNNGRLAVVASGFRLRHICPFGKTVISYSENEGETYTLPAPVIDTVLDDRDGGIMTFGKSGVIVTSFNNAIEMQKAYATNFKSVSSHMAGGNDKSDYDMGYLNLITSEEEQKYLGSTFRISLDNGVTFGPIHKSPVTSPHGPVELKDGSILWVGRVFNPMDRQTGEDRIEAHRIDEDGHMEFVGAIDNVEDSTPSPLSCEPHTVVLDNGRLLTHIRVQRSSKDGERLFTTYQSESDDNGKTWTKPHPILSPMGGAPSHILKTKSGLLVATYGYREVPYGVKAMFSSDNGETWNTDYDIVINEFSGDIGYPSTVELSDGSFLTVYYAHQAPDDSAVILQQKWRLEQ